MAFIGTVRSGEIGGQWELALDVYEGDYNIANNTSPCTANLFIRRTRSSYPYNGGSFSGNIYVDNGYVDGYSGTLSYPTAVGTSWLQLSLSDGISFTLYHNADGTKRANIKVSFTGNFAPFSTGGSFSADLTFTTIPRQANINSAPNFMDDENPTITYKNSAGNSVSSLDACISLTGSKDDIKYRSISKTGTSYTFNLTDAEREVLRKATLSGSNKRSVKFFVRTVIGGNTYYSILDRTFTVANADPTVTATMEDINEATLDLTKDSSVVVKDKSLVRITPTATALKDASITKITVNGKTVSGNYIDVAGANKYEVIATDNRGLTNKFTFQSESTSIANYFKFINYIPLTLNATFGRKAPTTGEVDVVYSGNYFNNKFSDEVNNTLSIKYRYKEKNEEWTGEEVWYDLSPEIKDNIFENDEILEQSFDYQKNFTFEIKAEDLLSNILITDITVTKGIPIVNWAENFFNVNGEIKQHNSPIIEEDNNVNGKYVKFANGTMICSKQIDLNNTPCNTQWGSLYETQPIYLGDFAEEFISAPTLTATCATNSVGMSGVMLEGIWNITKSSAGECWLCRATSSNGVNGKIHIIAIGRWK